MPSSTGRAWNVRRAIMVHMGLELGALRRVEGIATTHFSAITPDNSLKPDFTQREEGRFTLADGDRLFEIAAKCGAADVIARPFVPAELMFRVGRGGADTRGDKRRPRKSDVLIGSGAWIKELYDRIAMVAATDVTVAIFGESGTGKELVARTIHNSSPRHDAETPSRFRCPESTVIVHRSRPCRGAQPLVRTSPCGSAHRTGQGQFLLPATLRCT